MDPLIREISKDILLFFCHFWRMTISYDDICARAFEIWDKEGRPEGKDQDHWLRAEAELRKEGLKSQKGAIVNSNDPTVMKPGKTTKQASPVGKR